MTAGKFDLSNIVRPKIYNLEPYRCARDDFTEGILLDANENAHGPSITISTGFEDLHRYPDPHQVKFKSLMAQFRNKNSKLSVEPLLTSDNLCLGVGSDESVDALIRACCIPGKQKILINPPTYGMYSICAAINDVGVVKIPLTYEDNTFQLNVEKILDTLRSDQDIKLVFITSPGNPTGQYINLADIERICSSWLNGIVVVDEAYIDFGGESASPLVNKYPNLAVFQTVSKSFGLAGIRIGITFASKELSSVLNAMKAPYNISTMASQLGVNALSDKSIQIMQENATKINKEKFRVLKELTSLDCVEDQQISGLDANFIMIRMKNRDIAKQVYLNLATKAKVVVRYRGTELGCAGGLRITIGTKEENDRLIKELKNITDQLLK
ncbi:probable Histidinol-phosphate aminotransferase [Saccharomycodes ludwigii]|uniref:histidinol-phosphate transaminase n=1 Tax=Saccharomycodes ludwigii TaxID=36035 RepID=A0A376BB70_9ASCO|nr:probable Histidinol-phosphate aminotransferase [Saccharomycodes ludwigii]